MRRTRTAFRSLVGALVFGILGAGVITGCGGDGEQGGAQTLNMVTVNWIEGMAMTYMQEQMLEDSLNMSVDVKEVSGGGLAFSSVASGDRHFFNEAWLPTTHQGPWERHKENLQKLGYTYRGTTVGLAVPTYMEVDSMPDLMKYREELGGTINGIEAGAAINDQARQTLEKYGMADAFSVVSASGPATWQALKSAIKNKKPIVVVAWYPHWKWTEFDIKYVDGAHTGHNVDIWGYPEDIFTIVDNNFIRRFSRRVVCFLKRFEVNDEQIKSLMLAFRNRGQRSKREVAARWIKNNPAYVKQWMKQTEACVDSDKKLEYLPDDAAYSTRKAKRKQRAKTKNSNGM